MKNSQQIYTCPKFIYLQSNVFTVKFFFFFKIFPPPQVPMWEPQSPTPSCRSRSPLTGSSFGALSPAPRYTIRSIGSRWLCSFRWRSHQVPHYKGRHTQGFFQWFLYVFFEWFSMVNLQVFPGMKVVDMWGESGALCVEIVGYLVQLTGAILSSWDPQRNEGGNVELLTAITKPLTGLIIQVCSEDSTTLKNAHARWRWPCLDPV